MSTEWSDLERRLRELGSDVGGAPLPGPDAARSRARQRTRRQVAGAAIGVAAAAFGVIALGGLGPLSISQPEPAETPTPTPTPTEDAVEPGNELALTVEDLESTIANPEDVALVGWKPADPPVERFLCAPAPSDADAIERWFQTSDGGYLNQIIEISTAEAAGSRFESVVNEMQGCVQEREAENPDDNWLNVVWTFEGIGDALWTADYAVPPRGPNGELTIVQVSVVLAGDAVTIISQGGLGMHGNESGPLPHDIATLAADRLCTWAGRDCTGNPTPQRAYPPVRSEVEPGWLTVDDIVTAMPYFETISETGEIQDGDAYGHICMDAADPVAAGATAVPRRQYSDPLDDALEIHLFEFIARFDNDDAARAHYDDLVAAVEACGVEPLGAVEDADYEGSAWRVDDEFAPFHLSAVISGSDVGVLVIGQPSSAQDDLPPDQTLDLLGRAGARLAELE